MSDWKQIAPASWLIPQTAKMRVPGLLIASDRQLKEENLEKPLEQVRNVATLPGIVGYSIAMPDMHWGYGFPIGGVAAMDLQEGVISPGGVGYDINCGVRLALAHLPFRTLSAATKKQLLEKIFQRIPSGTGMGRKDRVLEESDYLAITRQGVRFSIEKGIGLPEDLERIESFGFLEGADLQAVSSDAKLRGRAQLGTIGSGNHFVEIGEVEKIFLPDIAERWQVEEGQTYILIHTGSRGFGHQICQDFLDEFLRKGFAKDLVDKQLVAVPIQSPEGKAYWAAMALAAHFAFNNRQEILHNVRSAFAEVCSLGKEEIPLLYDVCHNIAKIETHSVAGTPKKVCVHRKGATRAFGPEHPELAPLFQKTGQPVLVPGDMGRASHLMAGVGNPLTWCSCCHGAGRARSRVESMKHWKGRKLEDYMQNRDVLVKAHSWKTIAEEMPDAYKDVDLVVDAVEEASLARKVARLRPHLVLKG